MADEKRVRHVAFLRGMNVGGHRIRMDRLRALFEALGFSDVVTFLASGNVAFEAPEGDAAAIERRIEAHLREALGYEVETFVRTPAELADIVSAPVFPADDVGAQGHAVQVAFMRARVSGDDAARVASFSTERDVLTIRGRELFWLCRGRMSDTTVDWKTLGKTVPPRYTVRNMNTVRKIAAKYPLDEEERMRRLFDAAWDSLTAVEKAEIREAREDLLGGSAGGSRT